MRNILYKRKIFKGGFKCIDSLSTHPFFKNDWKAKQIIHRRSRIKERSGCPIPLGQPGTTVPGSWSSGNASEEGSLNVLPEETSGEENDLYWRVPREGPKEG